MKLKIHLKALGIVLGVVLFWGCDNWLDVRPESELNEDQMFATEQGYMDALYGVYVNMGKNELYGGSLPLTMDLVAQTFDVAPGSDYEYFKTFEYQNPLCTGIMDYVWERLYYCIMLTNNILKHLEDVTPEQFDSYYYLRGECLGLRAFLHYELLRIFAPDIKDKPDYLAIPYKRLYSNDIEPQLTVAQVFEDIIIDLEAAKEALKNDVIRTNPPEFLENQKENGTSEDVTENNDQYYISTFLENRKYRMNYYGVLATLARVYIDRAQGDDVEKAYQYAKEVISSGKFRLIQRDDFIKPSNEVKQRDALFSDEFVFALFSTKVAAFYTSCCYPASTFTKRFRVRDIASIFGTEVNDFRYMLTEQDEGNSQHILLKKHHADYENSKQKIRMLGLAEMYYIAAEAKPGEAYELMEEIMVSRGIACPLTEISSRDKVMETIVKEYRKEFMGDGQLFFIFKRLVKESFLLNLNLNIRKDDKGLVFPLPEAEIEYGERVSEIWK